ncbi:MAG TPA: hypothetical protein VK031_06575 [Tissierellaceae bacterium]|nr:hypothetical protein [Tissierellaceae bacterium]
MLVASHQIEVLELNYWKSDVLHIERNDYAYNIYYTYRITYDNKLDLLVDDIEVFYEGDELEVSDYVMERLKEIAVELFFI